MGKRTLKRAGAAPKLYQAMTTAELRTATGRFDRPNPPRSPKTDRTKTLAQLLAQERDLRKQIHTLMRRLARVHTGIAAAGAAAAERAERAAKRAKR